MRLTPLAGAIISVWGLTVLVGCTPVHRITTERIQLGELLQILPAWELVSLNQGTRSTLKALAPETVTVSNAQVTPHTAGYTLSFEWSWEGGVNTEIWYLLHYRKRSRAADDWIWEGGINLFEVQQAHFTDLTVGSLHRLDLVADVEQEQPLVSGRVKLASIFVDLTQITQRGGQ